MTVKHASRVFIDEGHAIKSIALKNPVLFALGAECMELNSNSYIQPTKVPRDIDRVIEMATCRNHSRV